MKKLKNLIKAAFVSLQDLIKIWQISCCHEILVCRSKKHQKFSLTFSSHLLSDIHKLIDKARTQFNFFAVKRCRKGREKSEREKKQINFTFSNSLFCFFFASGSLLA